MRIAAVCAGAGLALSLALAGGGLAAESRGLSVQLRASEARDASVVETVQLYSKSYALVIGIDEYAGGWPRLSNAVKDAEAVAAALEGQGFDVTLKRNLDSAALKRTFEEFFVIKGEDPDARLFVWFAGHGYTEDGEGYIVPKDAPLARAGSRFRLRALSLRRFGEYVRQARSKHAFAVFDSCFSGTIFETARSAPPPAITAATVQPVRQFLSSGDAGQEVSDNGQFRKLFIEAITGRRRADANGDGYLTASELGLFLSDKVTNYSNRRQTPRYGKLNDPGFDRGDFVFRIASVAPKRTAGAPSGGLTPEMLFWQSISDSERAGDYQAYLSQYPNGSFAALARNRLSALMEKKTASLTPLSFAVEALDETLLALRTANVREQPSASSAKVGQLSAGTEVSVTGRTLVEGQDWYRVALSGRDAYVFGTLLGRKPATPAVSTPPKASPPPAATPAVGIFPGLAPGTTFRDCPTCPEMVVIPAGSFRMGDLDRSVRAAHEVRIGYGFAVGKYEVTQDEWVLVMGSNPTGDRWLSDGRKPVVNVSWDDAKAFVRKLSAKTGKEYRLLSEAEWEYMARAGSRTKYPWGDEIDASKAKYDSRDGFVAVGSYAANAFGVHDTVGNVWEWVEDCWNFYYNGAPADGSPWIAGDCTNRVFRGGAWGRDPGQVRSSSRQRGPTSYRSNGNGLRVARTLSR